MNDAPIYLRNHEAVIRAFGYWPSFHDSPVLSFQLEEDQSTVQFALHAFESTGRLNSNGYYILRKHHIVSFVFSGVHDAELAQFVAENILFQLGFSSSSEFLATGCFKVALESAMGGDVSGSFVATHGEVTSVSPCDEHSCLVQPTNG